MSIIYPILPVLQIGSHPYVQESVLLENIDIGQFEIVGVVGSDVILDQACGYNNWCHYGCSCDFFSCFFEKSG